MDDEANGRVRDSVMFRQRRDAVARCVGCANGQHVGFNKTAGAMPGALHVRGTVSRDRRKPKMLPSSPSHNPADSLPMDLKFSSQFALARCVRTILFVNLPHIAFGQPNPCGPDATGRTSFVRHVRHVVGVGSEKEMVGPDAGRVVAFVQNEKSLGDFSLRGDPGETVCQEMILPPIPLNGIATIAIGQETRMPNPACPRFPDPRPEPAFRLFVNLYHGLILGCRAAIGKAVNGLTSLASLLTALAALGLITDSSSA